MRTMIKNICGMIILCGVILVLASPNVMAGGGINWKVDVKNDTAYKAKVEIDCSMTSCNYKATLMPGGRVTHETGAKCPCGIWGEVYDDKTQAWKKTKFINVGTGTPTVPQACTAACYNTFYKLCRKAGTDADTIRDGDFSWCKY